VSYIFDLNGAARGLRNRHTATYFGETIIAPPSTWLLRPKKAPASSSYRYRMATPAGIQFASGSTPAPDRRDAFESPLPNTFVAPYAAFGRIRSTPITIGARTLNVHLLSSEKQPREDEYLAWIRQSAAAIARYYGEFPAQHAAVFLAPFDYHGSQMGVGGASIILGMDSEKPPEESGRLWVAAHEMVHVGFPAIGRRHRWATEGLATYVESVARAQSDSITRDELWTLLSSRLPVGQPEPGDQGLDVTRTWARTYWGGALFWFLADVEIARATSGKKTLRDALRGLMASGGNTVSRRRLRQTLSEMDAAVELDVLIPLYERHRTTAVVIDLPALLRGLGIEQDGAQIVLNEQAPEAYIRRAIERRAPDQN
jgi:hypothetical protein